jgi:hypothetical protein
MTVSTVFVEADNFKFMTDAEIESRLRKSPPWSICVRRNGPMVEVSRFDHETGKFMVMAVNMARDDSRPGAYVDWLQGELARMKDGNS